MKITIAAEIFSPDIGGPATFSEKLAQALTRRGHQVAVICYSSQLNNDNYSFKLVRILRGQNTFFRYFKYFWQLLKLAWRSEVIYAQGPVCAGLPALLVAKLINTRLVVKVVGDYAWEQAVNLGYTNQLIEPFQKEKSSGKIFWLKELETWTTKGADKVIVPSVYLKNIVAGWGVAEKNIEVIYNAVENRQSECRNTGSRTADNKDIILSIGRLVAWKGFAMLIELIPELLKVNSNFKLVILGKGPGRKELWAQSAALRAKNAVEIKKVDAPTRDAYLSAAKLFVLNTGYEGLPHTVLEAFAAGLPVITTNAGGNPEVVKDGETGLLVEYNNKEQLKKAILRLWQDNELRERLVKNARQELPQFSFDKMIENTLKILESK